MQYINIGLYDYSEQFKVLVRSGKWKYELQEEIVIWADLPDIWKEIPLEMIHHKYYSIELYQHYVRITARKGYAFDGVTGVKFLEDPRTLFLALFHDILLQAIYDDKFLSKHCLQDAHRILLIGPKRLKHQIMYKGLKYLHRPWNKLTS